MNHRKNILSSPNLYFGILTIILVGLELFAANLAYANYGWSKSAILYIITYFNIVPIILFYLKKRFFGLILLLGLGAFIIPNQLILTEKLTLLKEEAGNIVNFVYLKKQENGSFPENIEDYQFVYPELREHIDYRKYEHSPNDFQVLYYVGTKNTSHYYTHSSGPNWDYYDD